MDDEQRKEINFIMKTHKTLYTNGILFYSEYGYHGESSPSFNMELINRVTPIPPPLLTKN